MKTLKQLTNVEKAGIVFSLFPEEAAPFVDTMKGIADHIVSNEDEYRKDWQEGLVNFNLWLTLAMKALNLIRQDGKRLRKSKRFFAEELFYSYQAMFSVHCLDGYAKTRQLDNRGFFLAVELFFN